MIELLLKQQYALFIIILIALVISLTFHEYGHAIVAKWFGDNTAERAGRTTLNPAAHIDPGGLLMVALIGFGYAKPVPTNPANYNSRWGSLFVAAAGPGMNLLIAVVTVNFYRSGVIFEWTFLQADGVSIFCLYLAQINLALMLFNLLPIGPLDGHYILPYFLPKRLAQSYWYFNQRYGMYLLLGLVVLHYTGVPVFTYIWSASMWLFAHLALY